MKIPQNTEVEILGTTYNVIFDEELTNADGLCDKSVKHIKVCKTLYNEPKEGQIKDMLSHAKKVLRHEVIHAYRNESGLIECASNDEEQWVDWFAFQYHKIAKTFKELGVD